MYWFLFFKGCYTFGKCFDNKIWINLFYKKKVEKEITGYI